MFLWRSTPDCIALWRSHASAPPLLSFLLVFWAPQAECYLVSHQKIFRWMTGQMCFFLNFGMNCPLFKTFRFYKQKCWLTTSIFQERDLWISSNGMGIVTWFLYGYSFDSPNSSTAYDYPVPAPCFPAFAGGQPQPSPPSTANPRSSTRAKQESRAELQVSVAVL